MIGRSPGSNSFRLSMPTQILGAEKRQESDDSLICLLSHNNDACFVSWHELARRPFLILGSTRWHSIKPQLERSNEPARNIWGRVGP